ncbi:hypothetical protein D3C74_393570 [compost metagenome]
MGSPIYTVEPRRHKDNRRCLQESKQTIACNFASENNSVTNRRSLEANQRSVIPLSKEAGTCRHTRVQHEHGQHGCGIVLRSAVGCACFSGINHSNGRGTLRTRLRRRGHGSNYFRTKHSGHRHLSVPFIRKSREQSFTQCVKRVVLSSYPL